MEIGIKHVALFTMAWIEMIISDISATALIVALFTRAWIEISIIPPAM